MTDIGVPNFEDTPDGRRYAIKYQIAQWRFEQWSGSELLGWLRGVGLGIRTSDFYAIRDQRLSGPPFQDDFLIAEDNEVLPLGWMENQDQWNMRTRYMYLVNVVAKNTITGEVEQIHKLVGSDELLTKDEIYDRLDELMTGLGSDPEHELEQASVIRGYRKY